MDRHVRVVAILLLLACAAVPASAQQAARREREDRLTLYERVRESYLQQIEGFLRVDVHQYDRAGQTVSVGYNQFFLLTTTSIGFTAYFYPMTARKGAPDAERLERHFAAAAREVEQAHPGTEVVVEKTPVTTEKNGRTYSGLRCVFRFDGDFGGRGQRQTLLSDLYVFRDGDRAVKYRLTFPAKEEKQARKRLEKFLKAFPWPRENNE